MGNQLPARSVDEHGLVGLEKGVRELGPRVERRAALERRAAGLDLREILAAGILRDHLRNLRLPLGRTIDLRGDGQAAAGASVDVPPGLDVTYCRQSEVSSGEGSRW